MKTARSRYRLILAALLMLCAFFVFTACSQKHYSEMSDDYKPQSGFADSDYEAPSLNAKTGEQDDNSKINEKLIKEVTLSAETLEFDEARKDISDKIAEYGGYVSKSNVEGESKFRVSSSRYVQSRRATYEIRIPAENLDAFLSGIESRINIYSSNEKVTDATETYYDIQARLETLESKKEALNEMLAKAENVSQLLDIQDKLYQTISEIESYKARLQVIDSKVSFSTVYLTLYEVEVYTPTEEESFGTRVKESFTEGWENFVEGWQNFTVWFVGALPGLLLFAAIALAIFLIIRGIIKKKRKNALKKAEQIRRASEERQQNAYRENIPAMNQPIYGNVNPGIPQQPQQPANNPNERK